jgi:hypothetical protein
MYRSLWLPILKRGDSAAYQQAPPVLGGPPVESLPFDYLLILNWNITVCLLLPLPSWLKCMPVILSSFA